MKIKRRNYEKLNKVKVGDFVELLYFCSICCILVNVYFMYVRGVYSYISLVSKFGYVGLTLVIIYKRFKISSFLEVILSVCVCVLVFIYADNLILIKDLLIIVASKDINIDKNLKFNFVVRTLMLLVIVTLFYLGKTDDYTMLRGDSVVRNGMGFGHPNTFAGVVFSVFMIWCYFKIKKMKWYDFGIGILLIGLIDGLCNSRTSEMVMAIALFLMLIVQIKPKFFFCHIVKMFVYLEYFILTILSMIAAYLYSIGNPIGIKLDTLLTGRLRLAGLFFKEYGISLLGHRITFVSSRVAIQENTLTWVLDNLYMYLLIHLGIIVFVLVFVIIKKCIDILYTNKNVGGILVIVSYMIFGLAETGMIRFEYNAFLVLCTLVFSQKKVKKKLHIRV